MSEDLYEHFKIKVDSGQSPVRIDSFLAMKIENVSRTMIEKAAKAEYLFVNGKNVKANYKIQPNDEIVIMFDQPKTDYTIVAEDIPLNIVYEDKELIIVNKEPGMVVHPSYGHNTGTLVNALANILPDSELFQEDKIRPGLVHRIDKDTSGLLVIAKTEFTKNKLAEQFFNHTTKRRYYALVWGDFDEDEGIIEGHIGRNPKDRKVMFVFADGSQGKDAITHYKVIERFTYVTLVECRLETGRTHQIRIHMKYIGHPLFNDAEYGGNKILKGTTFTKYKQFVQNCFGILPRQALHAKSLGFVHPVTKEEMYFDSEIPDDMAQVLEKWRRYTSGREL
ncbi:MAG: RluA family pseudouridine synthase [Bacteroidales bacterium]|nr:RluA family pseudouridine synthase [Bacteroidales bacterium]